MFFIAKPLCVDNFVVSLWEKVEYNVSKWERVGKTIFSLFHLGVAYANRRIHTHIGRQKQSIVTR